MWQHFKIYLNHYTAHIWDTMQNRIISGVSTTIAVIFPFLKIDLEFYIKGFLGVVFALATAFFSPMVADMGRAAKRWIKDQVREIKGNKK